MESLRILLADDHAVVRQGLRALLEEQPGWKVVAEVATGAEAVKKVAELKPHVAILDISMPSLNGLEAARKIIKSGSTRILILTIYDSDALVKEMLDIGVKGYVLKSDTALRLLPTRSTTSKRPQTCPRMSFASISSLAKKDAPRGSKMC